MGEMAIMDGTGDTKIIWDPDNRDEVKVAERMFKDLMDKGFTAFEVGTRGKKTNTVVHEFDLDLEKLIMSPAIGGG